MTDTRSFGTKITIAFKSGRGVAGAWAKQYEGTKDKDKAAITEALKSVPGDDPDKMAEIIGNKTWTHPHCDSCSQFVDQAWSIGEYGERNLVCPDCLRLALSYMEPAALAKARGEA